MTDWSAIEKSNEVLRLCTARLKAHRLKLPMPGDLVRVTNYVASLQVVNSDRRVKTVMHPKGALLLVIIVNTMPERHPAHDIGPPMKDPVELIFMSHVTHCLVRTGTREATEVMDPFWIVK